MKAAKGRNLDIVKLLLPLSDVKATTEDGTTALMKAAEGGNKEIYQLLLPLSDAKATTEDGTTVLMKAAEGGNDEIVKRLLPVSDAKATTENGTTALMLAMKVKNHFTIEDIYQLLLPVSDVNAADNNRKTVLAFAIDSSSSLIVQVPQETCEKKKYGSGGCTTEYEKKCFFSKIVQLLLGHPDIIVTDLDIQRGKSSKCKEIVQLFKQFN